MHAEALAWLCSIAPLTRARGALPEVVEFGSRCINGTARDAIPHVTWHGIDIEPGDLVDEVADAAEWKATYQYDCVVSAEVFEHTPRWPEMIERAADALLPGGLLIVTCATNPREPHNADGGPHDGREWYRNVEWDDDLAPALERGPWERCALAIEIDRDRGDLYLIARRAA